MHTYYIYVDTYMHTYVIYTCACIYKNIYAHTFKQTHMYTCMYIHTYAVYAHIYTSVYTYIHTCIYIYMYMFWILLLFCICVLNFPGNVSLLISHNFVICVYCVYWFQIFVGYFKVQHNDK